MRKFAKLALLLAAFALILPVSALAHDGKNRGDGDGRRGDQNAFRIFNRFDGDNDNDGEGRKSFLRNLNHDDNDENGDEEDNDQIRRGRITAVGSTTLTIIADNGTTYTVDVQGATLVRLSDTSDELADFEVDDRVWVKGDVSGSTIDAVKVFALPENISPAKAKGTVTAIDGDTITLETKHRGSVTVETNDDTVVKQGGEVVSAENIEVGSKLKIRGWWDRILEVLTAVKISLR